MKLHCFSMTSLQHRDAWGRGGCSSGKQKTRLPRRKNWEKQSAHPPVCTHTFPLLPAHCGEEEEKEGGW